MKKFLMIIAVFVLSLNVVYARDFVDVSRRCTVNFENADSRIRMYKIASMDENAVFSVEDKYSSYPVDYSDYDSLALTLSAYISRDNVDPEYIFTLGADDLDTGLYLVLIDSFVNDNKRYEYSPFMFSLPYLNEDDTYNYSPVINPKKSVTDVSSITVIKNWDDGNGTGRPESIAVELIEDNCVVDEKELNAANGFRYTFEGLDIDKDYSVIEKVIPDGYEMSISKDGNNYIITNRKLNPNYDNELPHTGQLWWPVPVLLAAGVFFLVLSRNEKNI